MLPCFSFRVVVVCLVASLAACQKPRAQGTAAVAPASEASAPLERHGALDDSRDALMREVFGRRDPTRPLVAHVPLPDAANPGPLTVVVEPSAVLAIDERMRVLIVSGTVSDEDGHPGGAHVVPGNLGAYLFERRDDRWFVAAEWPSFARPGFSGEPGKVTAVEFGPGLSGVAVETGSCWQGYCGAWLETYEATVYGMHAVGGLAQPLASRSPVAPCADWLKAHPEPLEKPLNPADNPPCFDVRGKWFMRPPADGEDWGDVEIVFEGDMIMRDPDTGKPWLGSAGETLVLARRGERYEIAEGENPNYGF